MIQTQPKKLTFAEYLAYSDGTDIRYELIDGELRPLPPESPENDPKEQMVMVLNLNSETGQYGESEFRGSDSILSAHLRL